MFRICLYVYVTLAFFNFLVSHVDSHSKLKIRIAAIRSFFEDSICIWMFWFDYDSFPNGFCNLSLLGFSNLKYCVYSISQPVTYVWSMLVLQVNFSLIMVISFMLIKNECMWLLNCIYGNGPVVFRLVYLDIFLVWAYVLNMLNFKVKLSLNIPIGFMLIRKRA